MIEYKKKFISENDKELDDLIALSKAWAEENCCPAYYENEPGDYIGHHVYVATEDGRISAYALGSMKVLEEKTAYNEEGEKAFEIDEIYVASDCRDKGIGRDLYRFIEKDVDGRVDLIDVIAASYQHEKLLNFYIKELGMQFDYALLTKRVTNV